MKNTMWSNEQSNRYFGRMRAGSMGKGFVGLSEDLQKASKKTKPLFPTYEEIVR